MITTAQLIACGIGPTQAKVFAQPLSEAFDKFMINTVNRKAAFIAQARQESADFARLEENLYYTNPARIALVFKGQFRSPAEAMPFARNPMKLANRVYANRLGNGDEASGHGWAFRGRGLFQLTGLANYREAESALNYPFVAHPEAAAQPLGASLTACWFFDRNHCSALADQGLLDAITKVINGPAMLEAGARLEKFRHALEALQH